MTLSQQAAKAAGLRAPNEREAVARRQSRFTYTDGPMTYLAQQVVASMQKIGWDAKIHTILRSAADQNAAFHRGVSRARAGQSPHQYGMAVDIIHREMGWPPLDHRFWQDLYASVKVVEWKFSVDLVSGVEWGWDYAHVELAQWREFRRRFPAYPLTRAQNAALFKEVLPGVYSQNWKQFLGVPDDPEPPTFAQAFRRARLAGLAEFDWRGKRYTTILA